MRGLNINGSWCEDPRLIKQAVFEYFKNVFSATVQPRPKLCMRAANRIDAGPTASNILPTNLSVSGPNSVTGGPDITSSPAGYVAPLIFSLSSLESEALESPFSESEVWNAVNECGSSKAPGQDCFNMRFYKKFWHIIKDDLMSAIEEFWKSGSISNGCNASFITLVPKKSDPLCLGDYRPISLIGSFYKVISKLLSNRIRRVVPNLVGFEQSAFIKGRNILDGALISNEVVSFLRHKKERSLIFKVDFEKAFDCLSWDFLIEIMEIMGFGERWRKWILSCLHSASISVLVNGSPTNEFKLKRGVRQGDPLSPFLFILAAEGLNVLTKGAVASHKFRGVKVGLEKIQISHLQYADDTIFFGEWSEENLRNLMMLLKCFELTSGLKVNYNKSNLFGLGLDKSLVENMARLYNCKMGKFPFIYLGLPVGGRMNKMESWNPVIDKFSKRLSDWKARSMSFGGRLTLIKSVLNSLPLYYFSLFRAPPCVLKKLECVRRSFFWGGSGNKHKISWVKWDDTLLPFEKGGLNLGSLKSKNLALIGKWWWRFRTETNSLWVKVISGIYGQNGGLGVENFNTSFLYNSVWSNIVKFENYIDSLGVVFRSSFIKHIGDGASTSFWDDVWLGTFSLKNRFKRLFRLETEAGVKVKDRIAWDGSKWVGRWNWARTIMGRTQAELDELNSLLLQVPYRPDVADYWAWNQGHDGLFTARKLNELLETKVLHSNHSTLDTLKNSFIPKKVELFVWRARKGRLPTLPELNKRGIDVNSVRCPICDEDIENLDHALLSCKLTSDIWSKILEWWNMGTLPSGGIQGLLIGETGQCLSDVGKTIWQGVIWMVCYLVWKNRNEKVFRNKCWNVPVAVSEIQVKSFEWIAKRCKVKIINWHESEIMPVESSPADSEDDSSSSESSDEDENVRRPEYRYTGMRRRGKDATCRGYDFISPHGLQAP
ncbi:uncharacterized protein [Rutidosis leptorrhynchoides]|uniref:uncharacterized protein n=1 Tax=Rutidosis leptorrhynchoides TaxID=125765 RepID=UPI003A994A7C